MAPTFQRIGPVALRQRLDSRVPPLVIDIRRREAFTTQPLGVPGALPMFLDRHPLSLPDVSRDQPIVAYCLCTGESSSARVAQWLVGSGYHDVAVLVGGLSAWEQAGFPLAPIDPDSAARVAWTPFDLESAGASAHGADPFSTSSAFLPLLVGRQVSEQEGEGLPLKREMTVLFVDMVESTPLLFRHSPEEVLALVQTFMEIVVDTAIHHCGDVHDFQGDGALLYFAGPGEAVPAAFRLRQALLAKRREQPELPLARLALAMGPLVIGFVGTAIRRSVAFVGPSINIAARILKLAPPGGIIATEPVVQHAQRTDPDLAREFAKLTDHAPLRGVEDDPPALFVARAPQVQHR